MVHIGTRGRRFAAQPRSVFSVAAFSLLFSACTLAVNVPPTPSTVAPLPVREKLPLRAAIVMTNAELEATYEVPFGNKLVISGLGRNLAESLRTSLSALFREVALVTTEPGQGFDVALRPKVLEVRAEEVHGTWSNRLRLRVGGSLQVSDRAGKPLLLLRAEGADASGSFAGQPGSIASLSGTGSAAVAAAPKAIAQLVGGWGEQLSISRDLELYAKGSRPLLAASTDIVITFSYPVEGVRLADETITVVGLVSSPRAIGRLELVVNGRPVPVSRDVRVQSTDVKSHPFNAQVPLQPGQNLITLTAIDAAGNAAQAVRTVLREVPQPAGATTMTAKLQGGERWAVVIGIDQYRDPSISSLRYATADAESMFKFLTARGGVKPANARLLLNKDATQRGIREVLGGFLRQKATKDDEVIIYYAGHGTTEPDQSAEGGVAKYLVPWDADPTNLFASAIPMEEIDRVFGRLAARKILMIQDTCFSGGAGGRTFLAKGLTVRSTTLTDRFLQDLSQREGRMILTASDVNQVSQEDPALGHGIFTHYFLEALGGAADLDGDGAVTVREVHLYLQRRVHERSNGAQTPQLYNVGDMVLIRK